MNDTQAREKPRSEGHWGGKTKVVMELDPLNGGKKYLKLTNIRNAVHWDLADWDR